MADCADFRPRRELNVYGYQFGSKSNKMPWPGAQLNTLLKLGNTKFAVLKKDIVGYMAKHLDLRLKGTEQYDGLRAIEKDLQKQYPDIFATEESKKRLYYVTRFVLHVHTSRRSHFKKRNEKRSATPTRSSPIITHSQKENRQSEVATKDLALKSNQGVLKNHGTPRSIPLSQSKRFRVGFEQNDHGMPESASSHSRSNESSKHEITSTINDPNQYRDIHNFLGTSTPPMTHLMDAFINFGCINADFLLAISSWSSERIREVLDQLSLGPNDRQITEMDKFILETHFKEYFTQHIGKRGNSDL